MDVETLEALGQHVDETLSDITITREILLGELILTVASEKITQVLGFLRDDPACQFKQLVDLCGVDYPDREHRFEVVYQLLSLKHNRRVRVKISTNEETPVSSVTGLFSTAGWFEREVWDMFGVRFAGHTDLRRLLTDYGFEGHPLRKDFPLMGHVECRYDEKQKRVIYEKVTTEFRDFDFESPWDGMTQIQLPGDEKATSDDG